MATPVVYLIHFAQPIGNDRHQAQHYIGFAKRLADRIKHHRSGNGAAIMAAVTEQGIDWQVVRTWEVATPHDGYLLEIKLKSRHDHKQLCPICNPNGRAGRFDKF
mgnify:CR=1 FL=1